MKRIKCTLMVMLALGFLMCLGQDAMAQQAQKRTKAEMEAKRADIKAQKTSNFEVRKATLGKKQIQKADTKGMRTAKKLDGDALKTKIRTNAKAKRANAQNRPALKSIEKKSFEPKQRKAFINNKNK